MDPIDDGSDAQRIRDMTEADRRRAADERRRRREQTTERSFSTIVRTHRQREETRRNTAHLPRTGEETRSLQRSAPGRVLSHIRRNAPGRPPDLARRAEVARALQTELHKRGAHAVEDTEAAQTHRVAELSTRTIEENAHVGAINRQEQREGDAREGRWTQVQRTGRDGGGIDTDVRRSGGDPEHHAGAREERRTEGTPHGPACTAGGAGPMILGPLIQRLVSAIHKTATADGRTHLILELEGGRLNGVRLTVSAEGGWVRCTLSNCDRALAQGLERAESTLSHGLARRGLQLDALTVERR